MADITQPFEGAAALADFEIDELIKLSRHDSLLGYAARDRNRAKVATWTYRWWDF
jgi:hypothetical protein